MKNIIVILGFVFFFCTAKAQTAADDVQQMIDVLKEQVANKEKDKPYDFSNAETLSNLTGLYAEFVDGNYFGPVYSVNHEHICAWQKWFEQNKNTLKYGILTRGLYETKIIISAQADGTFTTSVGLTDLERYQNNGFTLSY
jgi:hypothetical protein